MTVCSVTGFALRQVLNLRLGHFVLNVGFT